jgi:hypothetical protein
MGAGGAADMLRGTVEAFLPFYDVYITDWVDARTLPLSSGRFDRLADRRIREDVDGVDRHVVVPNCGRAGVPFMKRTIGWVLSDGDTVRAWIAEQLLVPAAKVANPRDQMDCAWMRHRDSLSLRSSAFGRECLLVMSIVSRAPLGLGPLLAP